MSLEIGQVVQSNFSMNSAGKAKQNPESAEETGNYFTKKFEEGFETMTGKSINEMQEEFAERREAINQAIEEKDLDTAVDLMAEDGLLGKIFKFGWDLGKTIAGFFKNLFN